MIDRLPPHAIEAEQGILGCILTDPCESMGKCIELLEDGMEAFYDLRHRAIYSCFLDLFNSNQPIDLVTVVGQLKKTDVLENVGGIAYLSSLPDAMGSAANVEWYIATVNEKHILRKIIAACTEAVGKAYESADVEASLDELERNVMAIRPASKHKGKSIKELVRGAIRTIEEMFNSKGKTDGISTGLIDLDKMTGGLHDGDMTVLAGFPGSGKTSLAMNIAEHAMINLGKKVGVFSLEMSAESLVTRCICSHARVNMRNVRDGFLAERDFPKISSAAAKIANAAIYFEDDSDMSIYQLRAKARRLKQQHGIELAVVDYLQLLSAIGGSRKVESRQQEVADISRGVKAIARELKIPVIALSQLNDDGKLRESRAIGQDADNVWILQIDGESDNGDEAVPVTLSIAKARNGPRGKVNLTFLKPFTRFESAAKVADKDIPNDDFSDRRPYND